MTDHVAGESKSNHPALPPTLGIFTSAAVTTPVLTSIPVPIPGSTITLDSAPVLPLSLAITHIPPWEMVRSGGQVGVRDATLGEQFPSNDLD